ncbi:MAG TPA: hypothetical protein VGE45_12705 [Chloroflexia bacterium]
MPSLYSWCLKLYLWHRTTEPCDDPNRPYFRPFNNVTRGQASKIVANAFFPN